MWMKKGYGPFPLGTTAIKGNVKGVSPIYTVSSTLCAVTFPAQNEGMQFSRTFHSIRSGFSGR